MATYKTAPPQALYDGGQSISFTQSATQKAYEATPVGSYTPANGPLTVGAWAHWRAGSGGNPRVIVGKGRALSNNLAWNLGQDASGHVRVDTSLDGTTDVANATTTTWISTDRWFHAAFTYNNGAVQIFLNGVLDTTATGAASLFASTLPVTIGGQSGVVGTISFPYSGFIREAFVIPQLLTAAQIQQVMSYGAQPVLTSTFPGVTFSSWPLNDAWINGTSAVDQGTAQSTLTLSGTTAEWYGRVRPRVPYTQASKIMLVPVGAGTTIATTPGTGWNFVANPTDIAIVQWNQQANASAITAGQIFLSYGTYDSANGGVTPAGKQDMAAGTPATLGSTIVGYDNESWGNTPVSEQNSITFFNTFCNDAHSRGLKFISAPSWTFLSGQPAAYAEVQDTFGHPADGLLFQTQNFDWSVDTFCSTVFPVLRTVALTNPKLNVIIQVQNITANVTKGADHVDLCQAVYNADWFYHSVGGQGLVMWSHFINPANYGNWVFLRQQMRPTGRTAAPVRTVRT